MNKNIFTALLMVIGLSLLSSCASLHTWPDHERSIENKIVTIQENIGDGLKSDAITLDLSQMYLRKLKTIRADYTELHGKSVSQEKWNSLDKRLDSLDQEINRLLMARSLKIAEPRSGERILMLQQKINVGRDNDLLPVVHEEVIQARLDSVRKDYLKMTEEGRIATSAEKSDISLRLDALTIDLNKFQ